MNYEERYKQAIEAAKRELHCCGSLDCDAARQVFRLFPELRESEDEKIRKEIIQSIKDNMCVIHKDKCIAWLEKQGEQSSWSEEDEEKFNSIIEVLGEDSLLVNWLKSLRDRVQTQPKQEWSNEDEKYIAHIIAILEGWDRNYSSSIPSVVPKCIDWLKSLKLNNWKPSEQNIKDLEWCADLVKDKMGVGFHRLQVFIDEIKKL